MSFECDNDSPNLLTFRLYNILIFEAATTRFGHKKESTIPHQ